MRTKVLSMVKGSVEGATSVEVSAALTISRRRVQATFALLRLLGDVEGCGQFRDGAAVIVERRAPLQLGLIGDACTVVAERSATRMFPGLRAAGLSSF